MIGVDYELFWNLNPKSLSPFIKAFSLKQKYDDYTLWLQGKYIQMAIASTMNKNAKYPPKPFSTEEVTKISSAEEIKRKMFERMKILNAKFGKEETNG